MNSNLPAPHSISIDNEASRPRENSSHEPGGRDDFHVVSKAPFESRFLGRGGTRPYPFGSGVQSANFHDGNSSHEPKLGRASSRAANAVLRRGAISARQESRPTSKHLVHASDAFQREMEALHKPRSAAVPAASSGGVSPLRSTQGGTPCELAGREACATNASGLRHFKPRLTALLESLRLDVVFERGEGNFVFYRNDHGRPIKVLDLVGGYGSLLFGHSHPVLLAEALALLSRQRPSHVQGSHRIFASRLADELSRRAQGDYVALFGNSGAEAVEAAIKHAILETGRRTFISLERGFHGKTLGALQLTANPDHREPFELAGLNVVRVPVNDIEKLDAAFASTKDLAGFVFEPILGEGGVHLVAPEFAQRAAALCGQRRIPLIADECQTGLGRTGRFLASESLGVRPDYVVLSKALGGGLAKISAVLIDRRRYIDDFDLKHTSTYADDDFSCGIALKVLEFLDETLLADIRKTGDHLHALLLQLREKYPDVIANVRGRGLMLGVEFRKLTDSRSFLLRYLTAEHDLGLILMGYLFHHHCLRVAPTLSDPFTLRLEPSALIGENEINHLVDALEDLCARLRNADAPGLTRFLTEPVNTVPAHEPPGRSRRGNEAETLPFHKVRLVTSAATVQGFPARKLLSRNSYPVAPRSRSVEKVFAYDEARLRQIERRPSPARVGWLCHLIDADDLLSLEPSFGELCEQQRENLLARSVCRSSPLVLSAIDVRSMTGQEVRLFSILLPVTSRWLKRQIDSRRLEAPQALVQSGVDLARRLGCTLVALGQYTSIVTLNGIKLNAAGIGVTTGNSYAIELAIQALERAHRQRQLDPAAATLAIIGAAGNIGRACAEILAGRYRRTILVGSNKPVSRARLLELAARIPRSSVATDSCAIRSANVVVAALNAVDLPLRPDYFRDAAIVCDLSVPASVSGEARALRPDVLFIKGGIARLPFNENLEIPGFPLPVGETYGCMAEALLLGFEGVRDRIFTGALDCHHVRRIETIAQRHGFTLADYKTACVVGSNTGNNGTQAHRPSLRVGRRSIASEFLLSAPSTDAVERVPT